MRRCVLSFLPLVAALVTVVGHAQNGPRLADFFTEIRPRVIDPDYRPKYYDTSFGDADFNGDGHQDLVVVGADYPIGSSATSGEPQPGRLFLGDGNGGFTPAPPDLFPVDTLRTVHPRKLLLSDFNGDGRADMFVSTHGWDANPFPGEQNRLYLTQPGGGWRDETATLPQFNDFSHSSAAGDLSGRGMLDIVVGNGYPAQQRVAPYTLINSGSGRFSMTRSNLPIGSGQTMDLNSSHNFSTTELLDLDADGAPDLLIGGDTRFTNKQATILWNRSGAFVDSDKTLLPKPAVFTNNRIDYDARVIDANGDRLPDLVLIGIQARPIDAGWFVQLLINKGDRQFEDETAARLPEGTSSAGIDGVDGPHTWSRWVRVLDFNNDGAPDFSIEFPSPTLLKQDQPVVWLNDGTGRFSVLRVSDFVPPGREWQVGVFHLVKTRNGYSVITTQLYPGSNGFVVTGLLATRPYRSTP